MRLSREQNAGMRARGGFDSVTFKSAPAACEDCPEDGAVVFAGVLLCERCALLRLINALRAEVADDEAAFEGVPTLSSRRPVKDNL